MMNEKIDIPVWEKYTLTIEEASRYFTIGQNKLRRLVEENRHGDWYVMNGNRILIKKKQFEKFIANARTIYVVVWAALIYRSQACVWRRRWNYVFSSKGLDYLSGNDGTGSDGIACGKQKGCIDCDLGAFGWCVGECSLIEGD